MYVYVQIEVVRSSLPTLIFLAAVIGTIALLVKFAMDKVTAFVNAVLASTKLWMAVCVVRASRLRLSSSL